MEARKIIITGGATRIGASIAKNLSGKNVEIVIHFNKSRTKSIALKKELEKNGTKIYLVKGNLNKEEDIRKIIKKITGVNTIFSTTGGTSDARFLKKIAPCLEFGLVNKTMHKIDERASIKDIKKLKKIYLHIIERYFD